jgi:hypothetical protein
LDTRRALDDAPVVKVTGDARTRGVTWHTAVMLTDPNSQAVQDAGTRLAALRPRVEAGDPWPLAERFDHAPEASWGPPEILAHCVEMVDYWRSELDHVAAGDGATPTPFGRTGTDVKRLAAIEHDRQLPTRDLFDRLGAAVDRFVARSAAWTPGERARVGLHPTGDTLTVEASIERFVGGHLRAHADQLEALLGDGASTA